MSKLNSKKLAELATHQDPQDRVAVPGLEPPEDEDIHGLVLWRVLAEEGNESGGGDTYFYVLTDGPYNLPDCCEAHRSVASPSSVIVSVERVESVIHHFTQDDDDADGCVNQTGRPIPGDVVATIVSLMRSLAHAQRERGKAITEQDRLQAMLEMERADRAPA